MNSSGSWNLIFGEENGQESLLTDQVDYLLGEESAEILSKQQIKSKSSTEKTKFSSQLSDSSERNVLENLLSFSDSIVSASHQPDKSGNVSINLFEIDSVSHSQYLGSLSVCNCVSCFESGLIDDVSDTGRDPFANSSRQAGTVTQLAYQLTDGYWGTSTQKWNLGSSGGYNPVNGTLTFNLGNFYDSGFSNGDGLSSSVANLYREAFKIYGEVLGIDFVETTASNADFLIGDDEGGYQAYSSSSVYTSTREIAQTWIQVSSSWTNYYGTGYNSYSWQTIIHEIGHSLGLGHQGDYNGSASYGVDELYSNDSWQVSMMSYFDQNENTSTTGDKVFLATPGSVDWLALNNLYSTYGYGTSNAFTGDTVYGYGTNISSTTSDIYSQMSSLIPDMMYTISDGGGIDTLNFSNFSDNQTIDLRSTDVTSTTLYLSSIAGVTNNLCIASGSTVENAYSGSGSDTIIGNSSDNIIYSGSGNDTITGGLGDDTINGEGGTDYAVYNSIFSDVSTIRNGDTLYVSSSTDGFDTLTNVEYLTFSGNDTRSVSDTYSYLHNVRDYDGNLHGGYGSSVADSYKCSALLDVNGDGVEEFIFTNSDSSRWATAELRNGEVDWSRYGEGGTTRVVGIYIDPLVASGDVVQGSDHDSQQRFQNDLAIDNLDARASRDADSDGVQEVFWKTNDNTAYLRALMHDDGNIRYANYMNETQLTDYLTANGDTDLISPITASSNETLTDTDTQNTQAA